MGKEKIWKIIIFAALLIWLGVFMAEKIDLTTADLGRHIKNGELILNEGLRMEEHNTVLNSNFYSYSYPEFPFVNHHWASGVLFYLVQKAVGFSGLSVFYILLSLLTFCIFFLITYRESDFATAATLSVFLIPLIAERREIRPEIFSYFFAAVFFLLYWLRKNEDISWRWLLILPVIMIIWVNSHIYFFLGFLIAGAFIFPEFIKKKWKRFRELLIILFLTAVATLVNPFGIKGALHPLDVYKNYGYTVAEEKSVWFVENYGIVNSNFLLAKVAAGLIAATLLMAILVNWRKISPTNIMLGIFFAAIGLVQIRNFTLFGLFALPVIASQSGEIFSIKAGKEKGLAKENALTLFYICIIVFAVVNSWQFLSLHRREMGVGLANGNLRSAEFFKSNNIKGPIFNNYDIGGYLIWNLFPQEKVFVDNRPEVYPNSFFSEVYKPMQDYPDIFEKVDGQYNFNSIFFYKNDITPWGISFLKGIKENQAWTEVFEDDYAVIYLKRNEINKRLIEK